MKYSKILYNIFILYNLILLLFFFPFEWVLDWFTLKSQENRKQLFKTSSQEMLLNNLVIGIVRPLCRAGEIRWKMHIYRTLDQIMTWVCSPYSMVMVGQNVQSSVKNILNRSLKNSQSISSGRILAKHCKIHFQGWISC